MIKTIRTILFSVAIATITVVIYLQVQKEALRWLMIFLFMIIAMVLASIILKEHPYQFYENFGNYKDAKVSAVLMLVSVIALAMFVKSVFAIIII